MIFFARHLDRVECSESRRAVNRRRREGARERTVDGHAVALLFLSFSLFLPYCFIQYICLSVCIYIYIYISLSLSFYQSLTHILSVFISSSISIFISFYLSLDLFDAAIITDSLAAEHRAVAARIAGEVI